MRIKTKIVVNVVALLIFSVVITSLLVGYYSNSHASNIITHQVQDKLSALMLSKKEQVENYFKTTQDQLAVLAQSQFTIDATESLRNGFNLFDIGDTNAPHMQSIERSMSEFYTNEFNTMYSSINGKSYDTNSLVQQLAPQSLALQYSFIANNPNPLGNKDVLNSLSKPSEYNTAHTLYHPTYQRFLKTFGFYDIFIVDADSGNVIYTVFKEVDFACSLVNGEFKNTGLAEAFRKAKSLKKGEALLVDFAKYPPSYEAPAAFLASPIFKQNQLIGVLIFQAPVDAINNLMTYQEKWETFGFGTLGQSYLIGSDTKMRSQSRFLIEDQAHFVASAQNTSSHELNEIQRRNSTIGLLSINNEAARRGLKGQIGIVEQKNELGERVLAAYSPVQVAGLTWAIITELGYAETFSALEDLRVSLFFSSLVVVVVIVVIGFFVSMALGSYLSKPILSLNQFMEQVTSTLDLTLRTCLRSTKSDHDEIGQLEKSLNKMLETINDTFKGVANSSSSLRTSVSHLHDEFDVVQGQSTNQNEMTIQLSAAIEEMSKSAESVAELGLASNKVTEAVVTQVRNGQLYVDENSKHNHELSTTLNRTSENVDKVAKSTKEIGSVLDVIGGIAEQTNLLALNAAIEAARAGEQGRGFAVVADEVRALAQKTQDSTREIKDIIEALQSAAFSTVSSMQESLEHVAATDSSVEAVKMSFIEINNKVVELQEHNSHVATSTNEQNKVSSEMAHQVSDISVLSDKNTKSIHNAMATCELVEKEYLHLDELVSKFKL